jgi:hypothetical protein
MLQKSVSLIFAKPTWWSVSMFFCQTKFCGSKLSRTSYMADRCLRKWNKIKALQGKSSRIPGLPSIWIAKCRSPTWSHRWTLHTLRIGFHVKSSCFNGLETGTTTGLLTDVSWLWWADLVGLVSQNNRLLFNNKRISYSRLILRTVTANTYTSAAQVNNWWQ